MQSKVPHGIPVPNLLGWRIWAGLSRDELGALARLSSFTIRQIEAGRLTRFSNIGRLANALGIDRKELLHSLPEPEQVRA